MSLRRQEIVLKDHRTEIVVQRMLNGEKILNERSIGVSC